MILTSHRRRPPSFHVPKTWSRAAAISILLSLSMLSGSAAVGQTPQSLSELTPVRSFRSFDKTNTPGLPQSTITAFHQDEKGVLWLSTLDGVATYDGQRFERVAGLGELPSYGPFGTFARRAAGGLYVGNTNSIYAFDGETWTRIPAPSSAPFLAEDNNGSLWRLDLSGGVWKLSSSKAENSWQAAPVSADITSAAVLTAGPDGALWIATRDRIYKQDGQTWTPVGADVPGNITAVLPSSDGSCWVGTESGEVFVSSSDGSKWEAAEIPEWESGRIRVLEEDLRGRIWAGGLSGGVAFGQKGEPWTVWGPENGLNREGCLAILADREGNLWFSANGHGVQQWIGEAWSHRNFWQGDEWSDRRLQIFGIEGNLRDGLLAAVFDRGIWQWTGDKMHQVGIEKGLTEHIRSAMEVEPGRFWVATRFGIFESDNNGHFHQTLELDTGFVYGFHHAPDGTWFASTSTAGLYRRQNNRWIPAEELNQHLPDLEVRAILWRSASEVWVGTLNGLQIFLDGQPQRLEPPSSIKAVHTLLAPDDGSIWIGGIGGIEARTGQEALRWTIEDGLPGNTIYSLALATDGAVWAGGSSGVGRYVDGRWQVYDSGSGLLEEECNHLALAALEGGSMMVGTMASMARFDASVSELPQPPLEVYWRQHPAPAFNGVLQLPADQRSVRLDWYAPWLAPDPVEYRVLIPRLTDRWSEPQNDRTMTLENLDAGLWEVQVAARFSRGGIWTEPVVTRLRIEPYFWETWIFRGIMLGLAVLAIVGMVRWRTRRLARRAAALEAAVQENLAQIKILGGLLPICSCCKKVRDDAGYWQQIESYIRHHSEADFSHGLCPSCFDDLYSEFAEFPGEAP